MSSSFESVATDLENYLKESLPQSWKIQDGNKKAGATTGLVLTYGLNGFSNTVQGQPLPLTHFVAEFDLVLSAPETDLAKAQARLIPALPLLLKALDDAQQLSWENAQREVLETGDSWFRIPIQILVSTTPEGE